VLSFVACANYDGIYEPACIAFEGDRIELRAGRFSWQKFTDQRTVDAEGNIEKPFPGFPITGFYSVDAGRLRLTTEDDLPLDDWFFVNRAGRHYLLTGKEYDAFVEDDYLPKCALTLTARGS
jgi:hypothetical protein